MQSLEINQRKIRLGDNSTYFNINLMDMAIHLSLLC